MTGLSWFEKRKYLKLGSYKVKGTRITFFADHELGNGFFADIGVKGILDIIKLVFRSSQYGYKFTDLNIVLRVQFKDIKGFAKGYIRNKMVLGTVKLGKSDTIYLNLIDLDKGAVMDTVTKENLDVTQSEVDRSLRKVLRTTVAHELAHLWRQKTTNVREITQKNMKRLRKFSEEWEKELEAYSKIVGLRKDVKNLPKILAAYYILVRSRINHEVEQFVEEGLSDFMALYLTGEMDIEKAIRVGNSDSKEVQLLLDGTLASMVRFLAGSLTMHLYNVPSSIWKRYKVKKVLGSKDKLARDRRILRRWVEQGTNLYPYTVGLAVYATLYKYGIPVEKIATLNQSSLFSTYDKVCKVAKIQPLISTNPRTNAVANFGAFQVKMNQVRKSLGLEFTSKKILGFKIKQFNINLTKIIN